MKGKRERIASMQHIENARAYITQTLSLCFRHTHLRQRYDVKMNVYVDLQSKRIINKFYPSIFLNRKNIITNYTLELVYCGNIKQVRAFVRSFARFVSVLTFYPYSHELCILYAYNVYKHREYFTFSQNYNRRKRVRDRSKNPHMTCVHCCEVKNAAKIQAQKTCKRIYRKKKKETFNRHSLFTSKVCYKSQKS